MALLNFLFMGTMHLSQTLFFELYSYAQVVNAESQLDIDQDYTTLSSEEWDIEKARSLRIAEIDIIKNHSEEYQLVVHNRDSYSLRIPNHLDVIATGFDYGELSISDHGDSKNTLRATIIIEDNSTIESVFEDRFPHKPAWIEEYFHPDLDIQIYKAYDELYDPGIFEMAEFFIQDRDRVFVFTPISLFDPNLEFLIQIIKGFKISP